LAFRPSEDIPITLDLGVDTRVFLFTLGISVLAGLFFGLAPALQTSRPNLVSALKNEAVGTERGERRLSVRNVLVVGQVAVSLVLLIGAGLLVRSLRTAHSTEVGFDADRLAVMGINLDHHGYSEETGKVFNRQLLERIRALPEVASAALATRLPVTLDLSMSGIYIEGHQQSPDDQPYVVDHTYVGPGYFATFGIQLLQGRDFDNRDTDDSPQVAVINETMARTYWPGEDPVGKRFHADGLDGPPIEIVGVCRDYNVRTIGEEPRPYIHWALSQTYHSTSRLVVRTNGDPSAMVGHLRQEMLAMEPDLVFIEADTMPMLIEVTLLPVRMGAVLIGLFGILGMILASVGLYGVIAYSVSRRTHEMGLRIALGAETGDVLKLVLQQGMVVVGVGIVLGLAGAAAVSRVLSSVLYGVSAVDPVSFGAAVAVLVSVAALANYIPAKRATRVDPVIALRYE
jgi:predicted permease